jgi:hypothetical protein
MEMVEVDVLHIAYDRAGSVRRLCFSTAMWETADDVAAAARRALR